MKLYVLKKINFILISATMLFTNYSFAEGDDIGLNISTFITPGDQISGLGLGAELVWQREIFGFSLLAQQSQYENVDAYRYQSSLEALLLRFKLSPLLVLSLGPSYKNIAIDFEDSDATISANSSAVGILSALASEWVFSFGLVVGVDWISVNSPFWIINKDYEYSGKKAKSDDIKDAKEEMDSGQEFSSLILFAPKIGFYF